MTLESKPTVRVLKEKHPGAILDAADPLGNLTLTIKRESLLDVCKTLKDHPELDYKLFLDVCGVDNLNRNEGTQFKAPYHVHLQGKNPRGEYEMTRFEAVYHLYSISKKHRVRLKVPLEESDISLNSVTSIWKGANWFEREAYDMFGFQFKGHPYLRRILTHEEFVGHPLRKDYNSEERHRVSRNYDAVDIEEVLAQPKEDRETGERMVLNIGPAHPATHGVFRFQVVLDGERIQKSQTEIGYLHRCFEKMCETHDYNQVMPYVDRLNYLSAFMNNVGYCLAVEKLLGIESPVRAQRIYVILSEFNRIMDHLVCVGTSLVDLGALTNFWYFFEPREEIYGLLESCCGARLTVSYARIGGLLWDIPDDFVSRSKEILKKLPKFLHDVDKLNTRNSIFRQRTVGISDITGEDAVDWGFTGPCLRAAGVPYDVRKAHPYYGYDQFEFDVPIGTRGDVYDRYLVRMEEMRQSIRIIEQALEDIPEGPVITEDKRVAIPTKEEVYSNIEALMNQFKLVMEGVQVPPGEVYSYTEGANGELGYYIISDGTGHPYRIKVRPPCYAIFQAFDSMIEGRLIADLVSILGSINIVAGELER
jgi:NADH-quinone oxidoreductase subunit C/D